MLDSWCWCWCWRRVRGKPVSNKTFPSINLSSHSPDVWSHHYCLLDNHVFRQAGISGVETQHWDMQTWDISHHKRELSTHTRERTSFQLVKRNCSAETKSPTPFFSWFFTTQQKLVGFVCLSLPSNATWERLVIHKFQTTISISSAVIGETHTLSSSLS